jgi:hypothetical protein
MFADQYSKQAFEEMLQNGSLVVFTAVGFFLLVLPLVIYFLFGDRRPLVRRLGDQFRQGQLDAEARAKRQQE